jgi:hypothetical protein
LDSMDGQQRYTTMAEGEAMLNRAKPLIIHTRSVTSQPKWQMVAS